MTDNTENKSRIYVKQTGSAIGRNKRQEATLIGLGLNKLNRARILENTPSVMGMVLKVRHLVQYEILENGK